MLSGIFVCSGKRDHAFMKLTADGVVYGPFSVSGPTLDAIVRPVLSWLELDDLPPHIEGSPCRFDGSTFSFVNNGSARSGTIVDDDTLQSSGVYRRVQRPAPLDINVATAVQLAVVPGLSAVRAQAIVAHRERTGPFASLEDLLLVVGVKRAALTKAQPWLCMPTSDG